MTVGLASKNLARSGGKSVLNETWVRPADWLPMPTITPGSQKVCMLVAVWNGNNYMRISVGGAAYTVDWGDGSAPENFASGVAADHNFSWAGCSGSTLTSLGYRQAMVTITPQGAGTFASFDIANAKHPSAASGASTGLLALEASLPTSALPTLGQSSAPQANNYCQHVKMWSATAAASWADKFRGLTALRLVEGLELSAPTSLQSMFNGCASLLRGPAMNTASVTSWTTTFSGCSRMVAIDTYDWSAATSTNSCFVTCSALRSVGVINSGNAMTMDTMFSGCAALTSIASVDTTKATSLASFFSGCSSLVTFPTLNTPANLSLLNTFLNCVSMTTGPAMDTSKVTTMSTCFYGCTALTSIPTYVTTSNLIMSSTFLNCVSLRTVPLLDTSNVTTMSSMFSGCGALQSVPAFDLTACTNTASMFAYCTSLVSVTSLVNTAGVKLVTSMFANCSAIQTVSMDWSGSLSAPTNPFTGTTTLRSVIVTGMRYSFGVASNLLNDAALNALYTSLGTAAGAQSVTVTSNPGIATDNVAIATAKGWTVAGS